MKRLFISLLILLSVSGIYAASYTITSLPFYASTAPVGSSPLLLGNNFTWSGSGPAIIIDVPNIVLDMQGFNITFAGTSNPNLTGVLVSATPTGSSQITIQNGAIYNSTRTSALQQTDIAIDIESANHVIVENMLTTGSYNGIKVNNSTDVQVYASQFLHALSGGGFVYNSSNVVFDRNCVFISDGNGLIFDSTTTDCKVLNCAFPDAALANLLVYIINGLIVDHCTFSNISESTVKANLVQLGGTLADRVVRNVIIRNCTFTNTVAPTPNPSLEGITIMQGEGFLIENNVFFVYNSASQVPLNLAGIHAGGTGLLVTEGYIKNNIIHGPVVNGIHLDSDADNWIVEDTITCGTLLNGIVLDAATNNTIRNNSCCSNAFNGIEINAGSNSNVIANNTTNTNANDGIFIASGALYNVILDNTIVSNGAYGIENLGGTSNLTVGNITNNNPSGNFPP